MWKVKIGGGGGGGQKNVQSGNWGGGGGSKNLESGNWGVLKHPTNDVFYYIIHSFMIS